MKILQDLYDSEINFELSCFWDGGFTAQIGDEVNGFVAKESFYKLNNALEWLKETAIKIYPRSLFAHNNRLQSTGANSRAYE